MPNIALIKNGLVKEIILADLAFASALPGYDAAINVDAQPTACVGSGYANGVFSAPPAQVLSLVDTRAQLIAKIDRDTDAIYGSVMGNRASEYAVAEEEAQQFKVAGYAGAVPDSVESWANAKSWTATQAADDIIATAAAWRTAQKSIRYNRLGAKEAARLADTVASLDAIAGQWAGFVVHIRTALGI